MFTSAIRQLKPAFLMLVFLTLLTGAIYPACITGISQVLFPDQAEGSFLAKDGRIIGSELIGQPFAGPKHFWGRPSATAPKPYDATASSGSNLSPTSAAFRASLEERAEALRKEHGDGPIPMELVTASGSGLDPHISPAAAFYQIPRVARATGYDAGRLRQLVTQMVEGRQFGFLGEERVNVVKLNLALDALAREGK